MRYGNVKSKLCPTVCEPLGHADTQCSLLALAGRRPHRDVGLLRRGRAQPLDKRRLNRVGLRALAAAAQLFHQTANA